MKHEATNIVLAKGIGCVGLDAITYSLPDTKRGFSYETTRDAKSRSVWTLKTEPSE